MSCTYLYREYVHCTLQLGVRCTFSTGNFHGSLNKARQHLKKAPNKKSD